MKQKFLFIVSFLLVCMNSFSVTYTTTASATSLGWDNTASWAGGSVPALNDWSNHIININHNITKSGALATKTASFVIASGITFTLNGNYQDSNSPGTLTMGSGSVWDINGDLTLISDASFSSVTSGATVNVSGSLNMNGSNALSSINGELNIGGDINMNSGSPTITGSGSVTWGGIVDLGGGASLGTGCGSTFDDNSGIDLSNCSVVLPVDFINVGSNCLEGLGSEVFWSTASEINNAYFLVEKSVNLERFTLVGELEGAGTSSEIRDYSYTDFSSAKSSVVYYRIKQVDYNGDFDYSEIVASKCSSEGLSDSGALTVFPTASDGTFTLLFSEPVDYFSVVVINTLGEQKGIFDFMESLYELFFIR